ERARVLGALNDRGDRRGRNRCGLVPGTRRTRGDRLDASARLVRSPLDPERLRELSGRRERALGLLALCLLDREEARDLLAERSRRHLGIEGVAQAREARALVVRTVVALAAVTGGGGEDGAVV